MLQLPEMNTIEGWIRPAQLVLAGLGAGLLGIGLTLWLLQIQPLYNVFSLIGGGFFLLFTLSFRLSLPGADALEKTENNLHLKPDSDPEQLNEFAHDLKAPLNAIIGFAGLMEEEMKGPLPEVYADYPGLIRQSGETMLEMVNRILNMAQAGPAEPTPHFQSVDLTQSARFALSRFQLPGRSRQVKLTLLAPEHQVCVQSDPTLLARIWDNLIGNALKYTPDGGQIFILVQANVGEVSIGVRDQGAGMSREDLQRIGQRFVQGDNVEGREGSGLGLSIVKQLTELHHGRLFVRTAPGEGTEVEVRLPVPD